MDTGHVSLKKESMSSLYASSTITQQVLWQYETHQTIVSEQQKQKKQKIPTSQQSVKYSIDRYSKCFEQTSQLYAYLIL
jgi:hypothetical protein